MKKTGFDRAKQRVAKLPDAVERHFADANKENAEEIVSLARVLIPVDSGRSRKEISNTAVEGGGQLVNFGRKAKVIEGNSGPRPFKNPAMRSTKPKRRARNKKALKDAIKVTFNG